MPERIVLHLDMDAFFAAVEQRDRAELRGKPVLIGHPGTRGVVATCSYEARRFGVRSAMPSVTAARLCPEAVWVAPRFEAYRDASRRIFAIVRARVPVVEQVSVDEAYGDLTGAVRDLADAAALARELKQAIHAAESLTASVGVSYCRFLAKVGSDLEKPDGLVTLGRADVAARLWPLPARVIPGVGPKTADRLVALGLRTVGDVARCPEPRLREALGAAMAGYVLERARGEDDTPVEEAHERKQVSEERTYREDLRDPDAIGRELLARCEGVAAELRRRHLRARAVVIKVRDGRYRTVTRTHTVDEPVDLASELYDTARRLLRERVDLGREGVRLLGVAAKDLVDDKDVPASLFPDERREREHRVAEAADRVRARFGDGALRPARLLRGDAPPRDKD